MRVSASADGCIAARTPTLGATASRHQCSRFDSRSSYFAARSTTTQLPVPQRSKSAFGKELYLNLSPRPHDAQCEQELCCIELSMQTKAEVKAQPDAIVRKPPQGVRRGPLSRAYNRWNAFPR